MSQTVVTYEGGLRCHAEHEESGTVIVTDAPKDNHGKGEAFSPSEMLSVSLGSCILSIMGIAAQSMGLDIAGSTASVHKEMGNAPRRISKIDVEVHIPHHFSAAEIQKLERAAHACPVHNVLKPEVGAEIHFTWGTP